MCAGEALRRGPGRAARLGGSGLRLRVDKSRVGVRLDDDGAAIAVQRQGDPIADGGGQFGSQWRPRPGCPYRRARIAECADGPPPAGAEADDAAAVERGGL